MYTPNRHPSFFIKNNLVQHMWMFTLPVHGISGIICDAGNICHAFMALVHISRNIEINTHEAVLTIPSCLTSARRVCGRCHIATFSSYIFLPSLIIVFFYIYIFYLAYAFIVLLILCICATKTSLGYINLLY